MLYVCYGSDADAARAHTRGLLTALKKKRPDAEYYRITPETWRADELENLLYGQGLFEQKCIVFADGLFAEKEAKEWLTAKAKEMGETENAFVLLERSLDAAAKKTFEKYAREVKVFGEEKKVGFPKKDFNVFSLADALGNRNRKELWSLLSLALLKGLSAEEIGGVLFWQVKAMALSAESESAAKAGLSPFVYMKSKRYAAKYSREELLSLSESLVSVYHNAHRGQTDGALSLERFALSI